MSLSSLTPEQLAAILYLPLQAPPAGVTANLTNPDSISYQIYITAGVCLALMVVSGILRLLTANRFGRKIFLVDEVIFLIGWVLCMFFVCISLAAVSGSAFGRHMWDVRIGAFTKSQLLLSLLSELTKPLAVSTVKVSVLVLYLRVFGIHRWMRLTCGVGIVLILAYHASMTITYGAMCAPTPSDGYDRWGFFAAFSSASCQRTRTLLLVQGAANIVIDLFLLLLPLPALWTLQMPPGAKGRALAMFAIGLSANVASIIGLAARVNYINSPDNDITRLIIPVWATSIAEMAAGVLVCCGPAAAVVYRTIREPMLSWLSKSGSRLRGGSLTVTHPSRSVIRLREGFETAERPARSNGSGTTSSSPIDPCGVWAAAGVGAGVGDGAGAVADHLIVRHDADAYPLPPLQPGIGKMTEVSISWTHSGYPTCWAEEDELRRLERS